MAAGNINIDELRAKAKAGSITPAEISQVIDAVKGAEGDDRYSLLYIIGRSFATQHEELVAGYLDYRKDPMLAKLALQILCNFWDKPSDYVDHLIKFLKGVDWDKNHDIRLQAISCVGEYLRQRKSSRLNEPEHECLTLLVGIFDDEKQRHVLREAAYSALARAYGLGRKDIPRASTRDLDLRAETNPKVLQWARAAIGR